MAKKRKKGSGSGQKVGRGNPPKHTQFRKGQSGNKKGRPKGSKNLSTYIMEAARDHVTATVGGRTRKTSDGDAACYKGCGRRSSCDG
jgi:hypothetical protein